MDSDLPAKAPELKVNTVPASQGNSTGESAARLPVTVISSLFKLHQLSDKVTFCF